MTESIDAARLTLMLNDLRLPAIKQDWPNFAARADKESWPASRFLAAIAEHEIAERDRRRLAPCFSTNHSPAPHSFNPVLSTNRCTGSTLDGGRVMASVSARRLSVEWSGIARSRPSRRMTEPISPSVCRRARRNTARSVSAVVIARAE